MVAGNKLLRITNSWRQDFAPTIAGDTSSDLHANYVSNASVDGYLDPNSSAGLTITNIDQPIPTAGYTFQAPPQWGIRSSPGELQQILLQMVQAEAELAIEISNYGSWQSEILRTMRLINARYQMNVDFRQKMVDQIA